MSTKSIIEVKYKGKIRVSQYGQWDGIIEEQGFTIFNILRDEKILNKLKKNLEKVRFIDIEGKDKNLKDIIDNYKYSKEKKMSKLEEEWFSNFITRDLGAEVLLNIIKIEDSEKEIILKESGKPSENDVFIGYFYQIDLDKMEIIINNNKKYNINELPSNDEILKDFNK